MGPQGTYNSIRSECLNASWKSQSHNGLPGHPPWDGKILTQLLLQLAPGTTLDASRVIDLPSIPARHRNAFSPGAEAPNARVRLSHPFLSLPTPVPPPHPVGSRSQRQIIQNPNTSSPSTAAALAGAQTSAKGMLSRCKGDNITCPPLRRTHRGSLHSSPSPRLSPDNHKSLRAPDSAVDTAPGATARGPTSGPLPGTPSPRTLFSGLTR